MIPKEELGENTNVSMTYSNLAEVYIRMDGPYIPLDEAIRDGKITLPEILAFARMDARNGFCQESYVSEHGLTHFSYTYPECALHLTYDVYETPDGKQTLIEELYVSDITDHQRTISYFYVDNESEWGYLLDREDWGITFEVSDTSPTQITLDYTQQGGQQIGDLVIESYFLYPAETNGSPDNTPGYIGWAKANSEGLPIPLLRDTSGQITMDWSVICGSLDPGNYHLKLSISDIYEESEVHPLMANFYDKQSYYIAFSIE